MKKDSLTIIIPAYNEENSLSEFLPEVISFCKKNDFKLIVVNDGSMDQTDKVLEEFVHEECFRILKNKVNKGYGGAIKEGISAAETEYVITIDADGQHFLEDITALYNYTIANSADMVVGNRKEKKLMNYYRSFGKWMIRKIAKTLMPIPIHDINSGMKIYNADLAKKYIKLCPNSMAFSDIIALVFISQRHLVLEIPISIKPRISGQSTISTRTAFETVREILNIVMLFNPMRIFFPLSIFCVVLSVLWEIPIFLRGDGISVGAMLGIMTGIIFFFLGLIAEQLGLIRKNNL